MIIETLILGILGMTIGAIIGYFYGKTKTDSLNATWNKWKVLAFPSLLNNKYYLTFKKGNQLAVLSVDDKNIINYDYYRL